MLKRWIGVGIVGILICTSIPVISSIPTRDSHVHMNGGQGTNGWYITAVSVTIDPPAQYQIDNGSWIVYTAPFEIPHDGRHLLVATGNYNGSNWTEQYHVNIDTTVPYINLTKAKHFGTITYTADCHDATSGVNRVEFYMNGVLRFNDTEAPYEWTYYFDTLPFTLTGIIHKPQFSGNNITIPVFLGVLKTKAFNMTPMAAGYDNAGLHAFVEPSIRYGPPFFRIVYDRVLVFNRTLVVPNNYTGHLGRFFVHATFS